VDLLTTENPLSKHFLRGNSINKIDVGDPSTGITTKNEPDFYIRNNITSR